MNARSVPQFQRKALFTALSGALLMGLSMPMAHAQDTEATIEEVVVVGSQIRGARITGALPVTVVGGDAIDSSAAVSGDDLFRSIPEAGDITFNGTYLGGGNSNAARGDVSTVSLRGLAQGNTLVLLNGRRSVVHPTSQTDNETPVFGYNVNALPVSGLERVEILKDGAAALYGSDAVAGVVNNVLKSDFEGVEIDMQYGSAEGDEWTANAVFGTDFAEGRGNLSVYVGTSQKDAIMADSQDYLLYSDRRELVEGTSFEGLVAFDQRSTTGPWGGFQGLGNSGAVRANGVAFTDAAGNFLVQPSTLTGCGYQLGNGKCYATGAVTANSKRDLRTESRFYDGATVLPSAERYNTFAFMNYDISDDVAFFGEVGLYNAETEALGTPPSSLASTPIFMPANAYWNPLGPVGSPNRLPGLNIPAAGLPIQIRNLSFWDFGGRVIAVENHQSRFLAGLRGEVSGWSWESALLYSDATVTDSQDHASSSATQAAISRTTPDAYNPFQGGDLSFFSSPDPDSKNLASTIDSMRIVAVRENTASLALWDFKVSKADLFALPGGDIGMAAGVELRSEKYEDNRDSRQDTSTKYTDIVFGTTYGSDLMGHSPSPDVKGDRKVTSAYVEFGIPIVSPEMDIPFMEAIDLQIAGRYEDYNDIGDVAKPKVAASWDIIEGMRIRGSWSEGFKAPNLEVLNIPLLERLNGRNDYVKCEADLRAGRITSFATCTQNYGVPGLRQGNAALVPEESESFSYGFVFEPMFIPDQFGSIILTVDRWNIQQTGIVGVLDEQSAMNLDYLARLSGGTNPLVGRAAPTPAEIAAFAGTGLAPAGEVLYVNAAFTNLRPLEVGGVDFGLVYQNEFGELGDLTLNLNVTKLEDFFQEADPQQQILLDAKTAGVINAGVPLTGFSDLIAQAGNPEIKWTLSATWSRGPVQVGFMTQYTDDVIQPTVLDAARNPWKVDSLQTYNLYAQYSMAGFLDGETTLRVGARNLTDEQPPLASGGYLGNLHQPQGRYTYASVRHAF